MTGVSFPHRSSGVEHFLKNGNLRMALLSVSRGKIRGFRTSLSLAPSPPSLGPLPNPLCPHNLYPLDNLLSFPPPSSILVTSDNRGSGGLVSLEGRV